MNKGRREVKTKEPVIRTEVNLKEDLRKHNLILEGKRTFLKAKYYQALGKNAAMQEHPSQGLTPGSPSFGDFRSASPPQSRWKDLNPPLPHPPATVIGEE